MNTTQDTKPAISIQYTPQLERVMLGAAQLSLVLALIGLVVSLIYVFQQSKPKHLSRLKRRHPKRITQ
jgi:hypothetical protein